MLCKKSSRHCICSCRHYDFDVSVRQCIALESLRTSEKGYFAKVAFSQYQTVCILLVFFLIYSMILSFNNPMRVSQLFVLPSFNWSILPWLDVII